MEFYHEPLDNISRKLLQKRVESETKEDYHEDDNLSLQEKLSKYFPKPPEKKEINEARKKIPTGQPSLNFGDHLFASQTSDSKTTPPSKPTETAQSTSTKKVTKVAPEATTTPKVSKNELSRAEKLKARLNGIGGAAQHVLERLTGSAETHSPSEKAVMDDYNKQNRREVSTQERLAQKAKETHGSLDIPTLAEHDPEKIKALNPYQQHYVNKQLNDPNIAKKIVTHVQKTLKGKEVSAQKETQKAESLKLSAAQKAEKAAQKINEKRASNLSDRLENSRTSTGSHQAYVMEHESGASANHSPEEQKVMGMYKRRFHKKIAEEQSIADKARASHGKLSTADLSSAYHSKETYESLNPYEKMHVDRQAAERHGELADHLRIHGMPPSKKKEPEFTINRGGEDPIHYPEDEEKDSSTKASDSTEGSESTKASDSTEGSESTKAGDSTEGSESTKAKPMHNASDYKKYHVPITYIHKDDPKTMHHIVDSVSAYSPDSARKAIKKMQQESDPDGYHHIEFGDPYVASEAKNHSFLVAASPHSESDHTFTIGSHPDNHREHVFTFSHEPRKEDEEQESGTRPGPSKLSYNWLAALSGNYKGAWGRKKTTVPNYKTVKVDAEDKAPTEEISIQHADPKQAEVLALQKYREKHELDADAVVKTKNKYSHVVNAPPIQNITVRHADKGEAERQAQEQYIKTNELPSGSKTVTHHYGKTQLDVPTPQNISITSNDKATAMNKAHEIFRYNNRLKNNHPMKSVAYSVF